MKRIIYALCSAASIIGLSLTQGVPIWGRIIIGTFGIACLVTLIYYENKANAINQRVCTSEEEIQAAMKEIITTPGKICIMSRDLSWVNGEIRDSIKRKHDVLIFVEKETNLTKELSEHGVQIKYYGKYSFEPKTRFTIIGYNKNNPQVDIANTHHTEKKKKKMTHIIYETSSGKYKQDEWINSLAIDMMNLCDALSEGEKRGYLGTKKGFTLLSKKSMIIYQTVTTGSLNRPMAQ